MVHVEAFNPLKTNLLWFLLTCSLLMGGAALAVASRPVPLPPTPQYAPGGVGGLAELAVINHLVAANPSGGQKVPVAHTVAIHPAGPDRWAAHVAVHDPSALRLWQVSVDTAQRVPTVIGLPALVPAPAVTPVAVPTFLAHTDLPDFDATVSGALTSLLTGTPALDRYTSADTTLKPITPPPFVGIEVKGISKPVVVEGAHMVLVEVAGQRSDGVVINSQYPLAVIQRDGRWEVKGILRAMPSLAGNAAQSALPIHTQQEGNTP